jgi:tetratricopeptide (TPR) repeat protein
MTDSPQPPSPRPLRVDQAVRLLPGVDGLGPLISEVMAGSRPHPSRTWTGSGELGTVGDRLVGPDPLTGPLEARILEEQERVAERLRAGARVVALLQEGDSQRATDELLEHAGREEGWGRHTDAEAWALAAARLGRESDAHRLAEALRRAARSARNLGRSREAGLRYEDAFRVARERGEHGHALVAAVGRGNVAVDLGRWEEAEGWYGRAQALLAAGAPPLNEAWQIHQNLGIVRRERGDLEGAERHLREAEEGLGPEPSPEGLTEVANGWGLLLLARGRPRDAELKFRSALARAEAPLARVVVRVNLGEALLAQGRTLDATEEGRRAEAETLAHGLLARLPEVYRLLGSAAHAEGKADAFLFPERALAVIRDNRLPAYEEALTLASLARIWKSDGDERAHEALREAARILRDLGMEERARAMDEELDEDRNPMPGSEPPDSGKFPDTKE